MNESQAGGRAEGDARRDVLGELIRAAGKRPSPRDEDYRRVLAASRTAWRAKVRSKRRRRWLYALAASLAAVTVGVTAVISLIPAERPVGVAAAVRGGVEILSPETGVWEPLAGGRAPVSAGARLRTVAGGRAAFDLARGASLRVDAGTELAFVSPTRIDLEAGTVYVDSGVGVRTARLEIATAFGTVRDIGTQFEVRALSTSLRLRVREGLVRLDQSGERTGLQGSAGEQIMVDTAGSVERAAFLPDHPDWSWAEALADAPEIEGQSAYDVMSWAARESGRRLVFADASAELRARNAVLSGDGEGLSPMQALQIAVSTADSLEYALNEGVITIRKR